jgi:hypothetical protein
MIAIGFARISSHLPARPSTCGGEAAWETRLLALERMPGTDRVLLPIPFRLTIITRRMNDPISEPTCQAS